mmetsp:Transcript_95386/g.132514  ORF Transcript_95386/g.132514 Transcript_95386/m.132514 type:complete len:238 (+) Transcript_95386:86-799(+)
MKEARSGVSTSTTASLAAESSDAMFARGDDGDREGFLREEVPSGMWCCSAHCSKDFLPQLSAVPRVPSRDICLGLADLTNIQPNFNGIWICVEVRGNMDRFLQEMGLDEELRQEAEHSNYGAYQQRQTIVQSGNNFEIANELKARVVSVFSVGGGVQPSRDLHGRLCNRECSLSSCWWRHPFCKSCDWWQRLQVLGSSPMAMKSSHSWPRECEYVRMVYASATASTSSLLDASVDIL